MKRYDSYTVKQAFEYALKDICMNKDNGRDISLDMLCVYLGGLGGLAMIVLVSLLYYMPIPWQYFIGILIFNAFIVLVLYGEVVTVTKVLINRYKK